MWQKDKGIFYGTNEEVERDRNYYEFGRTCG